MRSSRLACVSALFLLTIAVALAGDTDHRGLNATGFADPRGGLGGEIVRVTSLDANGPGSLRAALETKGPRIVVFEVGGVIDLQKAALVIAEPFVTVAGQTAPSPGITIIRGSLPIATHDVVVRHLRVRPGDCGEPKKSGWEPDGISTSGGEAYNVTIDHCSISWAVDENLSASGPRLEGPTATSHRITFSHCIIAEGLSNSSHAKGEHSKGSLIHDFCRDIAIIGNLYAHNKQRSPYFKAHTTGVIANNVIYNPGSVAIQLNYSPMEWWGSELKPENCRVSIVGNVMFHGADTTRNLALAAKRGDAYLEDNLAFDRQGGPAPLTSGNVNALVKKPVWPEGLEALPAEATVDYVIEHVGARPRDRDAADARIIRDFLARSGRIIDSQDEVGGYPTAEPTSRRLDVPETDIEAWLGKMARELE